MYYKIPLEIDLGRVHNGCAFRGLSLSPSLLNMLSLARLQCRENWVGQNSLAGIFAVDLGLLSCKYIERRWVNIASLVARVLLMLTHVYIYIRLKSNGHACLPARYGLL